MTSFVTHLECSRCQEDFPVDQIQQVCKADGGPLLVRYDLVRARDAMRREILAERPWTLWRYRELLPMTGEKFVSLGEPITPLIDAECLGAELKIPRLRIKDEGLLPTGTFKARGAAVGVTRALELGVRVIALPTAGNAGAAWAAYGARGLRHVVVVMPETTPNVIVRETLAYGAEVYLVPGSIAEAGAVVRRACERFGWYDASTLREPYRIEGKKTMGFELAEQLGWRVPDVIVYPTGGGVGLIGMWKAFDELRAIGWLDEKRPRFVAVQAEGCAPIVKAFVDGRNESEPWPDPRTFAAGIRVPKALGDFIVLKALREAGGTAVAVSDTEIADSMRAAGAAEGMLVCPEGGAALAGAAKLRRNGWIRETDEVVVFNTGTGLKYPESLQGDEARHLGPNELPDE
ncbi:MAG: threonine synthase [Chloroflexota bacterium]|nr:threonine synthase [Chloroflexota bacterium]